MSDVKAFSRYLSSRIPKIGCDGGDYGVRFRNMDFRGCRIQGRGGVGVVVREVTV